MQEDEANLQGIAERRATSRHQVSYRMDVSDPEGAPVGYLVDLTTGGMRVRFRPGLAVDRIDSLLISFPRWMELGSGIVLAGRFIWCKPLGIGTTEGGFAFEDLAPEAMAGLEALLARLQQADAEDLS